MALLASGFASILAYGLMQMKGIQGLNGWRWIFIIVCPLEATDRAMIVED
jgi:MFS family permease